MKRFYDKKTLADAIDYYYSLCSLNAYSFNPIKNVLSRYDIKMNAFIYHLKGKTFRKLRRMYVLELYKQGFSVSNIAIMISRSVSLVYKLLDLKNNRMKIEKNNKV